MEIETESKNYILRSLKPDLDELDEYLSWLTDIGSNKYINGANTDLRIEDVKDYIKSKNLSSNALLLGIFEKQSGFHIGNVKLEPIVVEKEAWFGILIGNLEFRNKGVGDEILKHLKTFARDRFKIRELYLGVHKDNLPAIALYLKNDFTITNHYESSLDNIIMVCNL